MRCTAYRPWSGSQCRNSAAAARTAAEGAARSGTPHPPRRDERADIGYREQRPYRYTDVDAGLWGVGYKSVRRHFDAQLDDPVCYRYDLREAVRTGR